MPHERRNASRSRRFHRLRMTAFPIRRETEKPIRAMPGDSCTAAYTTSGPAAADRRKA